MQPFFSSFHENAFGILKDSFSVPPSFTGDSCERVQCRVKLGKLVAETWSMKKGKLCWLLWYEGEKCLYVLLNLSCVNADWVVPTPTLMWFEVFHFCPKQIFQLSRTFTHGAITIWQPLSNLSTYTNGNGYKRGEREETVLIKIYPLFPSGTSTLYWHLTCILLQSGQFPLNPIWFRKRSCQVSLTLPFLVMYKFSYIVNSASWWSHKSGWFSKKKKNLVVDITVSAQQIVPDGKLCLHPEKQTNLMKLASVHEVTALSTAANFLSCTYTSTYTYIDISL